MSAGLVTGANVHVTAVPTVSSGSAYTAEDQVGGLITLTGFKPNASYSLQTIVVCDNDKQSADLAVSFFNTTPSNTSADNAAISYPDASLAYMEGVVPVLEFDYVESALSSVATVRNCGLKVKSSTEGSIFVLVKTGGTPTYTSTTALRFIFKFFEDGALV